MKKDEHQISRPICRTCYDESMIPNLKATRNPRVQESHFEREILIIVSGKTNFLLNGQIHSAGPGDVFFINRWIPHQCNYGSIKNDFKHLWIHLHKDRLFGVLYQNSTVKHPKQSRSWNFPPSLLAFLNERWDRAQRETGRSDVKQEIYSSIARVLCEEISYIMANRISGPEQKKDHTISWIKNYISMQYGRNSSLTELEALTGYNRYHLMRRFKKEYGMTIGEYINCVRRGFIADAENRNMRQKEIAVQLGFQSAAAFWLWQNRDRERNRRKKNPVPASV